MIIEKLPMLVMTTNLYTTYHTIPIIRPSSWADFHRNHINFNQEANALIILVNQYKNRYGQGINKYGFIPLRFITEGKVPEKLISWKTAHRYLPMISTYNFKELEI